MVDPLCSQDPLDVSREPVGVLHAHLAGPDPRRGSRGDGPQSREEKGWSSRSQCRRRWTRFCCRMILLEYLVYFHMEFLLNLKFHPFYLFKCIPTYRKPLECRLWCLIIMFLHHDLHYELAPCPSCCILLTSSLYVFIFLFIIKKWPLTSFLSQYRNI